MVAILLTLKGDEIGQVSLGLLNLALPALRRILLKWSWSERESDPKFKAVKKTDTKWSRDAKLCLPVDTHWATVDPNEESMLLNKPCLLVLVTVHPFSRAADYVYQCKRVYDFILWSHSGSLC